MKRYLLALALLLPNAAQAQVEYQFTNVVKTTTNNIFRLNATLLFRNNFTYADQPAIIESRFELHTSDRLKAACIPSIALHCVLGGTTGYTVGAVQVTDFQQNGIAWHHTGLFDANSCLSDRCEQMYWNNLGAAFGVLGCNTPFSANSPVEYMTRTCAADGYDGWNAVNFHFDYVAGDGVVDPNLTAADFTPVFKTRLFPLVTPEPSTWALMLVALPLVWWKRRRVSTRS